MDARRRCLIDLQTRAFAHALRNSGVVSSVSPRALRCALSACAQKRHGRDAGSSIGYWNVETYLWHALTAPWRAVRAFQKDSPGSCIRLAGQHIWSVDLPPFGP